MEHYLGQTVGFWLELKRRAEKENLRADLLEEIVSLKGKISFYESRIKDMATLLPRP